MRLNDRFSLQLPCPVGQNESLRIKVTKWVSFFWGGREEEGRGFVGIRFLGGYLPFLPNVPPLRVGE